LLQGIVADWNKESGIYKEVNPIYTPIHMRISGVKIQSRVWSFYQEEYSGD